MFNSVLGNHFNEKMGFKDCIENKLLTYSPNKKMAVESPQDLDGFLPLLLTSDIKTKVTVGITLITYLEKPNNSIECSDTGMFIDCIVQWLSNSNPKIAQYGIEIIIQLINRMQANFRLYISTILPLAVDRLGDSKESIKAKALFLIMKLMECDTISPQALFDKISSYAFCHKNSNVKEGAMILLLSTITEFGANCITISKIVPMIVKLLSDPNVQVRNKAFETCVELFKHVGEKLRFDLQKKYTITQNKMTDLMNKFDEVKAAGKLLPTAVVELGLIDYDETDHACMLVHKQISSSVTKLGSSVPSNSTQLQRFGLVKKHNLAPSTFSSHVSVIDEETFIKFFEDVPTLKIFSVRDLDDTMKKLQDSIQNNNELWCKRVDSLKKIRSLILTGATKYDAFFNNLKYLEHSFQASIKDLRSQVVRETCITIAFLSQRLGLKFNHFAESIFSNLIDLLPNSAKVIASSGSVAIRFILEYTHTPRLLPILATSLGSKSKDIRRACCEFFDQILRTWPTQLLKKHLTILWNSIKKGITDADSDARVLSRKAFWKFYEHFPKQGEILLNELEPSYRKVLLSNMESSFCSLKAEKTESTKVPFNCAVTPPKNISMRSSSAIDLQAAQRAKARAQYSAISRQKVNQTLSPQFISKNLKEDLQVGRIGRSRIQVSISNPVSRSGSPSSKLTLGQPKLQKSFFGIPRSQNTSREASPNKYNPLRSPLCNKRLSISTFTRPSMAQQILMQSQEAESVLADAFGSTNGYKYKKKIIGRSSEDYSDDSEASSICSESSVVSNRRPLDSFIWNKSHSLHNNVWNDYDLDIKDIISDCESSSWSIRKEGLINLQIYLQQKNIISEILLRRLTNVLTKMFMDSQTKVISLFLDALDELIVTHSQYLEYWLYILLVKLFNKRCSDILNSVHTKILKTIELVRLSFPCDAQLFAVLKFLNDPTQTPNVKMKIFAMSYLSKLAISTDLMLTNYSVFNEKKDYVTLTLTKIISWITTSNIKQGAELRRAAQEALITLYNLNPSQITLRLSQLPEEYQEAVSGIIKNKIRRNSVDQLMSPNYYKRQAFTNLASPPLQADTTEILNSEKIYMTLKQIPSKIRKYKLENSFSDDKNTLSNVSGISHASCSEINSHLISDYKNGQAVKEKLIKILDNLGKESLQLDYKQYYLNGLKEFIRDSHCDQTKHFKKIIRVLLKLLTDSEPVVRELSISSITLLVQKPEMVGNFYSFAELIIVKILNMCCDSYKPVVKVAEECLFTLSEFLQPETVVRVITPLVAAKEFPLNLMAIKMMTKVVEVHGSGPVVTQMKDIMCGLLQSYDNSDSGVRKSVVFCMVSLHKVIGEQEFTPYVSSLKRAKLKLLNLYIERAQSSSLSSSKVNS